MLGAEERKIWDEKLQKLVERKRKEKEAVFKKISTKRSKSLSLSDTVFFKGKKSSKFEEPLGPYRIIEILSDNGFMGKHIFTGKVRKFSARQASSCALFEAT